MFNPVKIIQIGVCHEHANGKIQSLKLLRDYFDIVGWVDERTFSKTPRLGNGANMERYEGIPKLTLDEALDYPGLEAVAVEVPNNDLVPVATRCMERSLAMHMDKPAGEELPPYKALLDGCKARNLPFQMGYMYRGNPVFQFIQHLVRENALGEIFAIDMDMNHGYGGEDYQEYLAKFKGGIMFNLGCHLIDFIVSIMGRPERVESFLMSTSDVAPGTKNNTAAVLGYPHATAFIRACSRHASGGVNERRLKIEGTNGWVEISPVERFDGKPLELNIYLKKACCSYPAGGNVIKFPPQFDRYTEQLIELAKMIRGEAKSPYTFEHDCLVHEVTLAAAGYTKWS